MQRRSPLVFFDRPINRSPAFKDKPLFSDRINAVQDALNYTLSTVVSSSNTLSPYAKNTIKGQSVLERMNLMRAEEIVEPCYTLPWIIAVAEQATRWNVGNCCEKSCVAFQSLLRSLQQGDLASDVSIELFNNPFVDHFFIVVGRDIMTDESDPETWNKDTIVCDPWAQRECYFLQSVGFRTERYMEFEAIRHLSFHTNLVVSDPSQPFILKQDVRAKSNEIKDKSCFVLSQPRFVLRSRYYEDSFTSYNEHVPMCYESWDYPSAKTYERQARLDKETTSDDFSNGINL